jgi:ankyrin repeat protein
MILILYFVAIRNAYSERLMLLLDLMLKKGADVHLQNKWLETPLHQACSRGCVETTLFLLRQGADPNALNYYNETPLHKACRLPPSQALKMVTVLIEHGSDPLIAGYCGNAISVAMQSGNQSSAEYLKQVLETKIVMIGTRGENMVEKIPGTRLVSSKSLDDQYRVHSAHMNVGPSIDNIDLETILFIRSENEQSRARTKLVQASSSTSVLLSPRSEQASEESTSATNSITGTNNNNRKSDASDESKHSSAEQSQPVPHVPKPPIPGLPLVMSTDEFRVEMGVEFIVTDDVLGMSKADLRIEDDNYSFDYGQGGAEDVVNIIGKLHSTFLEEPIAISILKTPDKQKHRGLFRTKAVSTACQF